MLHATLEYLKEEEGWFLFRVIKAKSLDETISLKISMDLCIEDVTDLGMEAERFIWRTIKGIFPQDYNYNYKLLIIDMTQYPYIYACIDKRIQDACKTDFQRDVYLTWLKGFDGFNMPTVVENGNICFGGLKYVN